MSENSSIISPLEPGDEDRPRVLVVEDDPVQQNVFVLLSKTLGFIVHIVPDANEAVRAAECVRFDAILMDVKLKGDDCGLSCTRQIRELERESGRHTPIIAVTAYAMIGDKETCLQAGMDDYLSKPFMMEELKGKLSFWLDPKNRISAD